MKKIASLPRLPPPQKDNQQIKPGAHSRKPPMSTPVRRASEELSIHMMLEEELLYPAALEALIGDDKIDVEEAYIVHFLVKTLIAKSETLKPGDKGFDATFKVMSEMVDHHVEEEEQELFPELELRKLNRVK